MSLTSRRHFLQQTAGLAAGAITMGSLTRRALGANERIAAACIGVRGQGGSLLRTFAAQKDVEVLYICDIDESIRGTRGAEIEKATGRMPKLVKDYRTILDDKAIDVLVIGTPDHWHALLAIHGWQAYDAAGKLVKELGGRSSLGLHIRNFLECVRSRKRENLNQEIAQGHVSSVMYHAGNIAWRTGKKLRLDPRSETFDDAEANKYLAREYRKGFELPAAG